MMIIKGKYSPDSVDVSKLNVFISYRTKEWEFASNIYNHLKSLGFNVFIDKYNLMFYKLMPRFLLKSKLKKAISESDYICIITSDKAIESEWIQFEFKEAVMVIGRVIFLLNNYQGLINPGDKLISRISSGEVRAPISTKYTTLRFPEVNKKNVKLLAIEMMNEPDEYWVDGRFLFRPFPPNFDLKEVSLKRKNARKMVLNDPNFNGIMILDVIPFEWEEIGCSYGDVDQARMWLIFDCGRNILAKDISDGNVKMVYVCYPIKNNKEINAFVVVPVI